MGPQDLEAAYFPSQRHAHVLVALSFVLLSSTLALCYGIWLSDGCMGFLPFISDLGLYGRMRPVFTAGLMGTSVLMLAALPHFAVARHRIVLALALPAGWEMANWATTAAGAAVGVGVALLGLFPWDLALGPHLIIADVIFAGGAAWAFGGCMLAWRFKGAADLETWEVCPRLRILQSLVALAAVCDLGFAYFCLGAAYVLHPEMFTYSSLETMLQLAHNDFGAYCTGHRGWHELAWVNLMALGEWLLLAVLLAGVATAAADLEAYRSLQRIASGHGRPFLACAAE